MGFITTRVPFCSGYALNFGPSNMKAAMMAVQFLCRWAISRLPSRTIEFISVEISNLCADGRQDAFKQCPICRYIWPDNVTNTKRAYPWHCSSIALLRTPCRLAETLFLAVVDDYPNRAERRIDRSLDCPRPRAFRSVQAIKPSKPATDRGEGSKSTVKLAASSAA